MYLYDSSLKIEGSSVVKFISNIASVGGGAIFAAMNSHVIIKENSNVSFSDNVAQMSGRAINIYENSELKIKGNSYITFTNYNVEDGYRFRNVNSIFLSAEVSNNNSAFKNITTGTTLAIS